MEFSSFCRAKKVINQGKAGEHIREAVRVRWRELYYRPKMTFLAVSPSVSQSVSQSVSPSVSQSDSQSVSQSFSQSAGRASSQEFSFTIPLVEVAYMIFILYRIIGNYFTRRLVIFHSKGYNLSSN